MGRQSNSRNEKDHYGWGGGRGRSGSPPSTAGAILDSEGTHRARTLLRHPWNSRGRIGDECRSMGRRIEGCPSLHDLDEGRWRNHRETPFEASVLLSRIRPPPFMDYS